jgi:multimeric flavodoxin WrbA
MMKVVAFNGSPRKDGNTELSIKTVFSELDKEGIATELVQLGGVNIRGCRACFKCFEKKNMRCIQDDELNSFVEKMRESEGIIIGSPTYFGNVSTEVKALIDRAGAIHVYSSINLFFGIGHMIIPGSSYWNVAFGRNPGEVLKDEEGMATFRDLGRNMAWLLKKLHG